MSPRRMLILDFDGVLVDTEPLNYASWSAIFAREYGLRHDGDHSDLVGLTLDDIFRLWMPELPDTATKERLVSLKNEHYFTLAAEQLTPMDGAVALVRRALAAGWYTAVASRSRRTRLLRTLDVIGFPAIFDAVLGHEDIVDPVTERKNHARAAQMFGITPAGCIVIEDSTQGVRDAVACGIGSVIGFMTSQTAAALLAAGAHGVVSQLHAVSL